jgi:hypothetical protein
MSESTAAAPAAADPEDPLPDVQREKRKREAEQLGPRLAYATNFMPHELVVYSADGARELFRAPASGNVARLTDMEPDLTYALVEGMEVLVRRGPPLFTALSFGEGVRCEGPVIVSDLVARYMTDNCRFLHAIWAPDTNPRSVVRNDAGQIVGTKCMILHQDCQNDPGLCTCEAET